MDPGEVFIPIAFFLGVAVVLWKFFETRHKERMSIIEKGASAGDLKGFPRSSPSPLASLKWGLLALFVGIGLIIANWLDRTYFFHDSVYLASMLVAGGVGLIVFYFIAAKKVEE